MIVPVDNVTASLVPDLILSTAFDQLLFALFPLEVWITLRVGGHCCAVLRIGSYDSKLTSQDARAFKDIFFFLVSLLVRQLSAVHWGGHESQELWTCGSEERCGTGKSRLINTLAAHQLCSSSLKSPLEHVRVQNQHKQKQQGSFQSHHSSGSLWAACNCTVTDERLR